MKIYINKVKENWIVDRFISEWKEHSPNITRNYFSSKALSGSLLPGLGEEYQNLSLREEKLFALSITLMKITNKNLLNEFMKRMFM